MRVEDGNQTEMAGQINDRLECELHEAHQWIITAMLFYSGFFGRLLVAWRTDMGGERLVSALEGERETEDRGGWEAWTGLYSLLLRHSSGY